MRRKHIEPQVKVFTNLNKANYERLQTISMLTGRSIASMLDQACATVVAKIEAEQFEKIDQIKSEMSSCLA